MAAPAPLTRPFLRNTREVYTSMLDWFPSTYTEPPTAKEELQAIRAAETFAQVAAALEDSISEDVAQDIVTLQDHVAAVKARRRGDNGGKPAWALRLEANLDDAKAEVAGLREEVKALRTTVDELKETVGR
ncbi:hypothetical protein JCM10207_005116 [Rhodosporidiobolus poonsookiae]